VDIGQLDLMIIGLYFVALIGVGIYAGQKVHGAEDYAVAGRQLSFPVLAGTMIGSAVGASATFGKAGKSYDMGYIILLSSLAYMLGYIAFAFIAPKLRRARLDTLPSVLQARYGAGMRVLAAVVLLLSVIAIFGTQLIAFGVTASSLLADLNISYEQAVLLGALIIVIYTLVGGLLAVAYTDLLQVIIMLIACGILLPWFIWSDMSSTLTLAEMVREPPSATAEPVNWWYIFSFFPTFLTAVLIDPSIWQRAAGARDINDLKPALWTTALFYGGWSIVVVTLGVVAYNILPALDVADSAIPMLVLEHMPPVVKGLCLAAIMAIMMSTADSVLLISGTTFASDIVKTLKPKLESQAELRIARSTIVVVSILGIVFAFSKSGIFESMMLAFAIYVSGLFVPVMAALFWSKADSRAAYVSAATGVISVLTVIIGQFQGWVDSAVPSIVVGLTCSAVSMILMGQLNGRDKGTALLCEQRLQAQDQAFSPRTQ
jgi:solute:Na+ symporter, SSS family